MFDEHNTIWLNDAYNWLGLGINRLKFGNGAKKL